MNLNNHLKETPSVKLHNPPGGKSNFSLGWGEPEQQQQQPTQNKVNKSLC